MPIEQGQGWLREWLRYRTDSVWATYRTRSKSRAGWQQPRHPDGFNFGNDEVHACMGLDKWGGPDLSRLDVLVGQSRNVRSLGSDVGGLTYALAFGRGADRTRTFLAECPEQRLSRVKGTAIVHTQIKTAHSLDVCMASFAPRDPDLNAVVQVVSVLNATARTVKDMGFEMLMRRRACRHRLERIGRDALVWRLLSPREGCRGHLGVLADQHPRVVRRTWFDLAGVKVAMLGVTTIPVSLAPGEAWTACFALVPARDTDMASRMARTRPVVDNPRRALDRTGAAWRDWIDRVTIRSGDRNVDELVESIRVLVKCFERKDGYHCCLAGMDCFYDLAVIRDNYWIQRGLQAAGASAEARKDWDNIYRLWKKNGLCPQYLRLPASSNRQPKVRGGSTYGGCEPRVEVPAYYVLMLKSMCEWSGADPAAYYDVVRDAMGTVVFTREYLQVLQSDETWIWACFFNSLDEMLDNSLLLIAAARFASRLAQRLERHGDARRFREIERRARAGVEKHMVSDRLGRYVYARSRDGTHDETPIANVMSRFLTLPCPDMDPGRVYRGLEDCWQVLRYGEGIRSDSRSTIFTGNSPGYFLYALTDIEHPAAPDLVRRLLRAAAATGCVWEIADVLDGKFAGEKRRAWDSAVVLMGLMHYLFGVRPDGDGVWVNPHRLHPRRPVVLKGMPVQGRLVDVELNGRGMRVKIDGRAVLETDRAAKVRVSDREIRVYPQVPQSPLTPSAPVVVKVRSGSVMPSPSFRRLRLTLPAVGVDYMQETRRGALAVKVRSLSGQRTLRVGKKRIRAAAAWRSVVHRLQPGDHAKTTWRVVSPDYAEVPGLEPRRAFRVVGHALDAWGVPRKRVRVVWDGKKVEAETGPGGWFDVRLNSGSPGSRSLRVDRTRSALVVKRGFVNHLAGFIGDGDDCRIVHEGSPSHAREIAMRILLQRNVRVPVTALNEKKASLPSVRHLVIVSKRPAPAGGERHDGYHVVRRADRLEVWIRDRGHVFQDTRGFIRDLVNHVHPDRVRPGYWCSTIFRGFTEEFGAAADDVLSARLRAGVPVDLFCNGLRRQGRSMSFAVDLKKARCRPFPKLSRKPYVAVVAERADWARLVDACVCLVVSADADSRTTVRLEIDVPQGYVLIGARGLSAQWEPTLDPVSWIHKADGTHTIVYELHPGKPIHRLLRNPLRPPTWRSVRLSLAKADVNDSS